MDKGRTTDRSHRVIRLNRTLLAFFFTFLILFGLDSTQAASLDFAWGTPMEITGKIESKIDRKGDKPYLIWPIQISNRTGKRWLPHLDVVAVTDTGKQYAPTPTLKVSASGEAASLANLESHLFPSVTRNAVVVFEKIDPEAKVIHFYVGGLIDIPERKMKYLRITYKRSPSGWKWEDSGALESF
ncbi:MAG: hypothetical protein EPO39_15185 [Candidatus Manganitrophaceae bacterium]|nr:MAG: hypothetical protein EPO39_15185 [Candidatus Manganitrophaceae bacterium]